MVHIKVKCTHCGEWIEVDTSDKGNNADIEIMSEEMVFTAYEDEDEAEEIKTLVEQMKRDDRIVRRLEIKRALVTIGIMVLSFMAMFGVSCAFHIITGRNINYKGAIMLSAIISVLSGLVRILNYSNVFYIK